MCDNRWVRIGSSNLNPSSLLGNYELDVLIDDPGLANAMEDQYRRDVARSREVASRPLRGPRRISQELPAALTHQQPEAPGGVSEEQPGNRRRAALVLRAVASNARRSVSVPSAPSSWCWVSCSSPCRRSLPTFLPDSVPGLLSAPDAEAFRRRADR